MTEQKFIDKYCCTDSHAEYCNDDCDSCEREFKKDLELIKERIRADAIDEFVTYLKNFMWWNNEADEKVIGEFALEEYAERIKR